MMGHYFFDKIVTFKSSCTACYHYRATDMSPDKMASYPENNRTWQIIHNARKGGYAVGGFCV